MDAAAFTLTQLQAESVRLQSQLGPMEASLSDAKRMLAAVLAEIDRRTRPAPVPRVSDHALLRFMERALLLDVEALRGRIMTETVKAAILAGAGAVTVEGVRFKIANNVVVTALPPQEGRKVVDKDRRPAMSAQRQIQEELDA